MELFEKNENKNSSTEKIEVGKGLFLSKTLADHWTEIVSTRLDYIKIIAIPSTDIKRTQSYFGYYPYLPKGTEYPSDYRGQLMFPLAQINFSETPFLKNYPEKGILQLFISMDHIYGMNFEEQDNQQGFCVRYYDNIDGIEIVDDLSFIDTVFDFATGPCPLYDPHKLAFSLESDYLGLYDLGHTSKIGFKVNEWIKSSSENQEELEDELFEKFSSAGHKIGGYPFFSQSDPREYFKKFKDYILLFQMDGDEKIMWGDAGVGNFFIHPHDLAKKDFSKVMYNWDCG
jgi:uncharacterized protein YwqG